MTKPIPPTNTKYKVGDWVYYRDSMYKIIIIARNWSGWQYVIKRDNWTHQVNISDGDFYFRKA